jgi:NhaP-type Na+/H+ or K+/H+ antiporter
LASVVLEIVLGIVVGPHVFGWVRTNHVIDVFATIGMLFLFFGAGFEINHASPRWRPRILAYLSIFSSDRCSSLGHKQMT